jgi:hypothetical protein
MTPALRLAVAALAALAPPAQAAVHAFCWIGANGYRMEGGIGYPDALEGGIVTERDVTEFVIAGWQGDAFLGRWSLEQLTPETTWVLRFDTRTLSFPMGGYRAEGTYQAWNADGTVDDCGVPGFGFNGGSAYQDVCVDNTFRRDSSIEPDTPLAISVNPDDPCGPVPMSALSRPPRAG